MTETALADEIIKLALELQRVSSYEEARADAILVQLEQDLRQLLATRDLSASSRREIEAIIKQANEAIAGRFANIQGILDVEKLIETVSNRTVEAMSSAGIPTTAPTAETLRSLSQGILIEGSPLAAWWDKQAVDTAFRFAGAVRNGVLLGETNEQIVRRVAGEQGVIGISRRNARTLVHSSIMTAANRARLETFRKNAKYAQGVRWLASLDSHTCMRCAALDGKGWDFDGRPIGHKLQFQVPALHANCRCVLSVIPARKALDEIFPGLADDIEAARDRATAQGPQKVTMTEWLQRNADAAEEILGKRRVELFKKGELTLSELVTKGGRQKTLAELNR